MCDLFQIHVSSVSEALDSPRTYSSGGEAGDSEGEESLSEAPMSEEESMAENQDYIPKVCVLVVCVSGMLHGHKLG